MIARMWLMTISPSGSRGTVTGSLTSPIKKDSEVGEGQSGKGAKTLSLSVGREKGIRTRREGREGREERGYSPMGSAMALSTSISLLSM